MNFASKRFLVNDSEPQRQLILECKLIFCCSKTTPAASWVILLCCLFAILLLCVLHRDKSAKSLVFFFIWFAIQMLMAGFQAVGIQDWGFS